MTKTLSALALIATAAVAACTSSPFATGTNPDDCQDCGPPSCWSDPNMPGCSNNKPSPPESTNTSPALCGISKVNATGEVLYAETDTDAGTADAGDAGASTLDIRIDFTFAGASVAEFSKTTLPTCVRCSVVKSEANAIVVRVETSPSWDELFVPAVITLPFGCPSHRGAIVFDVSQDKEHRGQRFVTVATRLE